MLAATRPHHFPRRSWYPLAAGVLSATMLLTACLGKNKESGGSAQVAAVVNGQEISIHQVQAVLLAQPALAARLGDAAVGKVTDSLIEQELAAQAARDINLDESPKVLQAMEVAKREILARAYQDHLADKVVVATDKDINQYYDEHPQLFSKRRVYSLQEAVIVLPADQASVLRAKVEGVQGVAAVNQVLSGSGVKFRTESTVVGAEDLPLDILPRMSQLEPGQSVAIERPDGLMVLTLIESQEVPVSQAHARKAIQAALTSMKRRELVRDGMKALRDKAQVERKAHASPSPASAAASAAP
jgi:EpsD family peptidyl-prolyl cis-trans isomerase